LVILFCARRKIMPSTPGWSASPRRMWLYVSSRSWPDRSSSWRQANSGGTIGSGLIDRVARSSAIFKNSKNVSCSV
jgi:hypothetical protein